MNAESVLASSNFSPEVFQHREDMDIEKAPGSQELDRPQSSYLLPTLHADDTSPGGVVVVKKDRW